MSAAGPAPAPHRLQPPVHLLLGEDGRGYELARRLDACGAWRAWLGDSAYPTFAHHLSSPTTWDAFISPSSSSTPRTLLLLQLRVRALLFDKAASALSASELGRDLNPNHLQLHGDDVYFTLADESENSSQNQYQPAFSPCKESFSMSQRHRQDELTESWYKQISDKLGLRQKKFSVVDKEIPKRTPEGMSSFLKFSGLHKKKRKLVKDGQDSGVSDPLSENDHSFRAKTGGDFRSSTDETFVPEVMFPHDCVPESALPRKETILEQKIEVYGVLDRLPMSRNVAMVERFGVAEYYKFGTKFRGKDGTKWDGSSLSYDQAFQRTRKLSIGFLINIGFDGTTAVSAEILSEVIGSHICKLGRILKLVSDSYRNQCSSIELLRMFLRTAGFSNIGALVDIVKASSKPFSPQIPQQAHRQASQPTNSLLQASQIQRQLHPQMNVGSPQNLSFQQQQMEKFRRHQMQISRGNMIMMDKNRPVMDVKLENVLQSQADDPYSSLTRQELFQLKQQQMEMTAMNSSHSSQQQFTSQQHSAQFPPFQTQNMYGMRMPPVKVEAFQEISTGDTSLKPENDPGILMSPPK